MAKRQRPEQRGPDRRIQVPHSRGPDYREHIADGGLCRVDGDIVKIVFFINDQHITYEHMELQSHDGLAATYKPVRLEEKGVRTDVVAVRIPVAEFMGLHATITRRLERQQGLSAEGDAESGSE